MTDDRATPSQRERALAEVWELNRRYLLLVRELYDYSPEEAVARTGLPRAICERLASLTTEELESLAHSDAVVLRDRFGAYYWERTIQDLSDPRRLELRKGHSVLLSAAEASDG